MAEDGVAAVFGSRMMQPGSAIKGGMPIWKFLANKILTSLANLVLRLGLTEYHSGFRAYTRQALERLPFRLNSNDFVFDTEIIIQLKIADLKIVELPISTRYFPAASMIGLSRSIAYGLSILANLFKYILFRVELKSYPKFKINKI
jgi:hypothetical protein